MASWTADQVEKLPPRGRISIGMQGTSSSSIAAMTASSVEFKNAEEPDVEPRRKKRRRNSTRSLSASSRHISTPTQRSDADLPVASTPPSRDSSTAPHREVPPSGNAKKDFYSETRRIQRKSAIVVRRGQSLNYFHSFTFERRPLSGIEALSTIVSTGEWLACISVI